MRFFRFAVPAVLLLNFLAACSIPFSDQEANLAMLNGQRVVAGLRPPVSLSLQQSSAEFLAKESSTNIPKIDPRLLLRRLSIPIEIDAEVTAGGTLADVTLPDEIVLDGFTLSFKVTDGTNSAEFSSVSLPGSVTLQHDAGNSYSFVGGEPGPLDLVVAGELMAAVNDVVIGPDTETFDLELELVFTADLDPSDLPADFTLTFMVSDGIATISGRASL